MTQEQNKKTPRQFQCRDYLWEIFEQMSTELECSTDYLINEAMRQYARSRNYGAKPATPAVRPTLGPPPADGEIPAIPPIGTPPQAAAPQPIPSLGTTPRAPVPAPRVGHPSTLPPPPVRPPPKPTLGTPPAAGLPSLGASVVAPAAPPSLGAAPPSLGAAAAPPALPTPLVAPPPRPYVGGPTPPAAPPPVPPPLLGRASAAPPPLPPGSAASWSASVADALPPLSVVFNGQKIPVQKEEFIVGRGSKSADLPIKDGNISRRHAAIVFQSGAFYMKDLGSTNGVEFQGRRIDQKQIDEGDIFQICDYELRFTYR